MDSTLFIADLHLNARQPEVYQRFEKFLKSKARSARALYILGDLFEYYLGDDAMDETAGKVCDDLRCISQKFNTLIFFMPGNRDFLLKDKFTKSAGMTLLEDPSVIHLDKKRIILTHADELCTDDIEYQKIRLMFRNPDWQKQFLSLSIQDRIRFAEQARKQSQQHTNTTSSDIMDVNTQAVEDLFLKTNCNIMIHGHTHRPAFHSHEIDGKIHQRLVVGDWHYQTSYLEYCNGNFTLVNS